MYPCITIKSKNNFDFSAILNSNPKIQPIIINHLGIRMFNNF